MSFSAPSRLPHLYKSVAVFVHDEDLRMHISSRLASSPFARRRTSGLTYSSVTLSMTARSLRCSPTKSLGGRRYDSLDVCADLHAITLELP